MGLHLQENAKSVKKFGIFETLWTQPVGQEAPPIKKLRRTMDCRSKIRYANKKMAEEYAQTYNKNIFIKENEFIQAYHCSIHQGWHVGHPNTKEVPPHIRVQNILDELKS